MSIKNIGVPGVNPPKSRECDDKNCPFHAKKNAPRIRGKITKGILVSKKARNTVIIRQDYVQFIKTNPRYGNALKHVGKAERYMQKLGQAGYATDPQYVDKVIKVYNGKTIAKFEPARQMAMNNTVSE